MTVKDFRKLCKEHNAMDYAMVIANSRAKEEYPFTARNLRVNSDLENVEIHFSMSNKLVDYTNDQLIFLWMKMLVLSLIWKRTTIYCKRI